MLYFPDNIEILVRLKIYKNKKIYMYIYLFIFDFFNLKFYRGRIRMNYAKISFVEFDAHRYNL